MNVIGLEQSDANVLSMWVQTLKRNLHIFVSLSPLQPEYRNHLRNFPSLVNCTTIDYYFEWPHDALCKVADHKISAGINLGEFRGGLVDAIAKIHKFNTDKAAEFATHNNIPIS